MQAMRGESSPQHSTTLLVHTLAQLEGQLRDSHARLASGEGGAAGLARLNRLLHGAIQRAARNRYLDAALDHDLSRQASAVSGPPVESEIPSEHDHEPVVEAEARLVDGEVEPGVAALGVEGAGQLDGAVVERARGFLQV